jgi:hypothetical protein
MNLLLLKQKRQPHDITFYRVYDDEGRETLDGDYVEYVNVSPVMIRRAEDVADTIPMEFDVEEDTVDISDSEGQVEEMLTSNESPPTVTPPETVHTIERGASYQPTQVQNPTYNLRPNRARPDRWTNLLAASRRVYGLHFSTRAAIKTFGQEATDAMVKEMSQIVEKGTIKPVKVDKVIKKEERAKVIRSHMFFKEISS